MEPTERSTLRVMMTRAWPTARIIRIVALSIRSLTPWATGTRSLTSHVPMTRTTRATATGSSRAGAARGPAVGGRSLSGACSGCRWVTVVDIRPPPLGRAGRCVHDELGGRLGARELGADAALVHDEDPVGHAQHLGQLGGDHQDRHAAAGEVGEQPVHLGLGADVDAPGGLVDDEQRGVGRQPLGQHDLLLVAAGERGHRVLGRAGLDLQAPRPRPRPARLLAAADQSVRRAAGAAASASTLRGDRQVHDQALLAPVLGDERHAGVDGGLGRSRGHAASRDITHLAGVVRVDAEDGAGDLAAARADEAGQGDDLAGADLEVDVVRRRPAASARRPAGPARRSRRPPWGTASSMLAADHLA